jgi:hypothetical protein
MLGDVQSPTMTGKKMMIDGMATGPGRYIVAGGGHPVYGNRHRQVKTCTPGFIFARSHIIKEAWAITYIFSLCTRTLRGSQIDWPRMSVTLPHS